MDRSGLSATVVWSRISSPSTQSTDAVQCKNTHGEYSRNIQILLESRPANLCEIPTIRTTRGSKGRSINEGQTQEGIDKTRQDKTEGVILDEDALERMPWRMPGRGCLGRGLPSLIYI